jgi:hypothetical protein
MAQDIGLLLRGLGAAVSNQVPQFRQQMAQEQEAEMRQQEFQAQQQQRMRQGEMQNMEMMQARQQATFQDADAAIRLAAAGNYEAIIALGEDRMRLDERLGGPLKGDTTPMLVNMARRAAMGDAQAASQLNLQLLGTVEQGRSRGVLKMPEVQLPLSTVGKIEADFKANRITEAQRDQAMLAASRGGTSVSVNASAPTPPTGYQNIFDESGRLVEQRPIQGSPAATAQATREEQQQRYGDIVIEDIDRYKNLIVNQGLLTPVTGISGAIAQAIPGTPAADARALEQTIGANIQFDRLQAMREASPTGGALGSITEKELSDLRATLGSIGRSQSDAQLIQNLTRLENMYSEIKRKADAYPGGTAMPSVTPSINGSQGTQNSDPLGLRRG